MNFLRKSAKNFRRFFTSRKFKNPARSYLRIGPRNICAKFEPNLSTSFPRNYLCRDSNWILDNTDTTLYSVFVADEGTSPKVTLASYILYSAVDRRSPALLYPSPRLRADLSRPTSSLRYTR